MAKTDIRDWVITRDYRGRKGKTDFVKRGLPRPTSPHAPFPLHTCIFGLAKEVATTRRNTTYEYRPPKGEGVKVQYHDRDGTWTVGDSKPTDNAMTAYNRLQNQSLRAYHAHQRGAA